MAFYSRTCVATLSFALIAGCGHLAFTDLPEDADSGIDANTPFDGNMPDVVDAGNDGDTGTVDAGCSPPACPGTYVSVLVGSDADGTPGTPEKPLKSIKRGLAHAKERGHERVFVAEGSYREKVTLVEGISLSGGYTCASQAQCSWAHDPAKHPSVVWNQDSEGVVAPKDITRKTVFESIKVHSREGLATSEPGNVVLTLDRGAPTVKNCKLIAENTSMTGPSSARNSIAVSILGPSNDDGALLEGNQITSAGGQTSIAVSFDDRSGPGTQTNATLRKNVIRSGTAPISIGVHARTSSRATLLHDNDISAGTATAVAGDLSTVGWAIVVRSPMTIDGNDINLDTVNPPSCPSWGHFCGGIWVQSSATITNNVVLGARSARSTAVMLLNGDIVLNGNTLDGGGAGNDAPVSTAIVLRSDGGGNAIGKIRNNILLGGVNKSRYGVYEDSLGQRSTRPAALENNDFWNPPMGIPRADWAYRLWDGNSGYDLTFAQFNAATSPIHEGNMSADPSFTTAHHLRVQPPSPCIDRGTATEAPPRDFDGEARPKGGKIDIGADEAR